MSEFKGTPGPWMVDEYGDVTEVNGDFFIAGCAGIIDVEKDAHNANLIAAAPDLLEALQESMRIWESHKLDVSEASILLDCRAAIAKALGQ